jgi:type I restriction enzyme S subunit
MRGTWEIKKLGDVADVFDGPHATPTTVDSGPIFLGISALQDGEINLRETRHVTEEDFFQWTRRVRPQANDVVFSYETRLGQAAIIPEGLECCLGRRMGLLRFSNGAVFPRYFLYQYISPQFREFLESKTIRGATVDRLSIKDFPSFPILLPPLPEQQRIVALLDEAFVGLATAKANAERNLQNARAIFESHLQAVFSQRGEGWVDRQLASLCTEITVGHVGSMKTEYKESGIPFLRSQNIRPFEVSMDNSMFIDEAFHRTLKKSQLRPGDLAIVRTGYPGTAAVIPPELPDSNCSDLVIVRPGEEIDPHFLAAFDVDPKN